jgi:hypothetical protein
MVVGEFLQLQLVEAEGALPAIVRALGSATLRDTIRQFYERMVDSSRRVVEGDVRVARSLYAFAERVEVADDERETMANLVHD